MRLRPVSLTAALLLALVLAVLGVSEGQSAFPVRFDDPPEDALAATGIETASALNLETGRNYSKSFTFSVNPAGSFVNVLDITATTDDTVVVVRVTVASTQSDVANGGSLRERIIRANWDTGSGGAWSNFLSTDIFHLGNGEIGISANVAGSGPLEITVNGGPGDDLMTVTLEVVANHDVTFAEFTEST